MTWASCPHGVRTRGKKKQVVGRGDRENHSFPRRDVEIPETIHFPPPASQQQHARQGTKWAFEGSRTPKTTQEKSNQKGQTFSAVPVPTEHSSNRPQTVLTVARLYIEPTLKEESGPVGDPVRACSKGRQVAKRGGGGLERVWGDVKCGI